MINIFQTERLIFRTWNQDDPQSFLSLCCDPGIRTFASETYSKATLESAKEFVARENHRFLETQTGKFAVYLKETPKLVGISGIFAMDDPFSDQFEINYCFIKNQWGKGLGIEAAKAMINYGFENLKQKRIFASVDSRNIRSQHLLRRVGMSFQMNYTAKDDSEEIWMIERKF